MDVDGLSAFLAVSRLKGFSAAAQALGRTQPAISRRIALLEAELGAPLFDRTAGGAVLSQAGRALLPYAERAMAAVEDARSAVRDLATETVGPVSLAIVGTLADTELAPALRRFAAEHPGVDLRLRTATSAEVSELVRRGEATLGLRYHADPSPDLACEVLWTEPLVVVCAPEHPLAGGTVAGLAELQDERWLAFPIAPGREEIAASHVFGVFHTRGLGQVDWTAVDSLTAQRRLVEAGFGVALMPESFVAVGLAEGTLQRIEVADLEAARPVASVVRHGGYLSAAARRLLELLASRCRGLPKPPPADT